MKNLPFLLAGLLLPLVLGTARADSASVPGGPFDAARYQPLWQNSPFAVATPVAVESVEYALVGAGEVEGVFYASLIDKQSQQHFVVTSQTPAQGVSLVEIVRGNDPQSTYATLKKNGAMIRVKLDIGAPAASRTPTPNAAPPFSAVPPVLRRVRPVPFGNQPPPARFFPPPVYIPRPSSP